MSKRRPMLACEPAPSPEEERPQPGTLAGDVLAGLSATPKRLSSKYFYDAQGSRLFERIMRLPSYYPTRVEARMLRRHARDLLHALAPTGAAVELLELGSGDGRKTLALCRAWLKAGASLSYRPMDISAQALDRLGQRMAKQLPDLAVHPLCGDYFQTWPIPRAGRHQVALFLGSNLGNFAETEAVRFLRRVRAHLRAGDSLLLGLDLRKDPHTVLAAYNDPEGVTAAFNLNLLRRLNRELGMDFALDAFRHYASYCPLQGVARSFLVSQAAQAVHSTVLGTGFHFARGEVIYTEQSQKYDQAAVQSLTAQSGFAVHSWFEDPELPYALVACRALG
ncbi:MAG: L-histidine N(alpha)-methyltransferase [Hydrogenophaga sp.]|uniref:L-histidine N(alpha)-methyltransferase n=1 Tax=Hydrogenophaga sp. TaxID=1904254 RepID=UPI001D62F18A|nr:L-histidine N(alpha)-methyltransferase [Hydrogenophaga sp.]MBX3611549.1 L-histidine N(alpha)-methyltransferase [Hydrogenophaga sp.]